MTIPRNPPPTGTQSELADINRLIQYEFWVVANATRATFAGWRDKVIALLIALGALAALQSWFAQQPWRVAASAASVAGVILGLGVARLLIARLAFHRFDGVLAADALRQSASRRYMAAFHGVAVVLIAAVMLIVQPSLIPLIIPNYGVGATIAGLLLRFGDSWRIASNLRSGWVVGAWLRRARIGAVAAAILGLSLGLLRTQDVGVNVATIIAGVISVLIGLMLTKVDDSVIRFMAILGRSPRSMIFYHAQSMLAFTAGSVTLTGLLLGSRAAIVVIGTSAALLLLLTLRVLAYRLHDKRPADLLIGISSGLLMLTAYYLPIALPVIIVAMLLRIWRRGGAKTWLLS
jgi:hypothetical protein